MTSICFTYKDKQIIAKVANVTEDTMKPYKCSIKTPEKLLHIKWIDTNEINVNYIYNYITFCNSMSRDKISKNMFNIIEYTCGH